MHAELAPISLLGLLLQRAQLDDGTDKAVIELLESEGKASAENAYSLKHLLSEVIFSSPHCNDSVKSGLSRTAEKASFCLRT